MTDTIWVDNPNLLNPLPHQDMLDWLSKPYVLSKALKRLCEHLEVKILFQGRAAATEDENELLPIEKELPLVRQIVLLGDGRPFTMGRVIIPFSTLQQHPQLNELGNELLGETHLYNNSAVTRGPFSFALIPATPSGLSVGSSRREGGVCARRSLFWINANPLLVTDLFLSSLPAYTRTILNPVLDTGFKMEEYIQNK